MKRRLATFAVTMAISALCFAAAGLAFPSYLAAFLAAAMCAAVAWLAWELQR